MEHGAKDMLAITRGKNHECLDMAIDFGLKKGLLILLQSYGMSYPKT